MANCLDRAIVEQDILFAQERNREEALLYKGNTSVPPYYRANAVITDEDWDDDVPKVSLSSNKPAEAKGRFKDVSFMTPAQKKAYYKRLKINYERKEQGLPELEDEEEPDIQIPGEVPVPPQQQQQLRLPKDKPKAMQHMQPGKPKAAKPKPSVFEYSLSMAGIGRGTPKPPSQEPTKVANGISLGIGRGMAPTKPKSDLQNGVSTNAGRGQISEDILKMIGHGRGMPTVNQLTDRGPGRQNQTVPGYGRGYGVGRGLSMGDTPVFSVNGGSPKNKPTFVVPNVAKTDDQTENNSQPQQVVNGDMSDSSDARSAESESEKEGPSMDVQREVRKIQKKLRAIELLEEKKLAGEGLAQDEELKLEKKEEFQAKLASLNQS